MSILRNITVVVHMRWAVASPCWRRHLHSIPTTRCGTCPAPPAACAPAAHVPHVMCSRMQSGKTNCARVIWLCTLHKSPRRSLIGRHLHPELCTAKVWNAPHRYCTAHGQTALEVRAGPPSVRAFHTVHPIDEPARV